MITALDTSVLLDVLGADPVHGPASAAALRAAIDAGSLVACEVVWAETAAFFPSGAEAATALGRLGLRFEPLDEACALAAADAWRAYRRPGGRRERVVADFLIGAHAVQHAERLLTRDRGFFRSYFAGLAVIAP